MSEVDLRIFFRGLAREWAARLAARMRRGLGVGDQALPPKVYEDGKPLGGLLPHALQDGIVYDRADGFAIYYRHIPPVGLFHRGDAHKNQKPRPIVGMTEAEHAQLRTRVVSEIVRQLNLDVAT